MEKSSSLEINSRSAGQEIPHLLRNPEVYLRVYKDLPLFSALSQIKSVLILTPYLFQICFNVILDPCRYISAFVACNTFSCCHACYMPPPPPLFDYPNNIWCRVQTMKLLIVQFFLSSCYFAVLGRNVVKALFSNTLLAG